jgi:hypothetical protein
MLTRAESTESTDVTRRCRRSDRSRESVLRRFQDCSRILDLLDRGALVAREAVAAAYGLAGPSRFAGRAISLISPPVEIRL